MSEKNLTTKYRLSIGQYLGEISALCFLRLPYLLAGTGSQLLLYDIGDSAKLVESFRVFEGIRVHGITCGVMESVKGVLSTTRNFELAVFGEKRVKLFNLSIDIDTAHDERLALGLHLVVSLPRFSHWVMDVSFLKSNSASPSEERRNSVAIGCSDNSVRVWDVSRSCLILEVQSPERCLLYSMRLWGDNLEDLLIASGTIFNEIIVWKVIPRSGTQPSTNPLEDDAYLSSSCNGIVGVRGQQHEAVHISRLVGHEGSIFRIVWSLDGSNLVSVSDDRSARIWAVNAERKCSGCQEEVAAGTVLFGHSARVWDCCISSSLVVTAGEDCTCRLWGLDGKQLKMVKEHIGRGVWRCLYDSDSSLLITAGFDSAIKVHQLSAPLPQSLVEKCEPEQLSEGTEIFICQIPNSSKHIGLMDSKSEYVRCLHLKSEDSLYVATNNGYLYHAKFSGSHDVSWTKLVQVRGEGPIICMDLMSKDVPRHSNILDDWIAFGDGKGKMTITRVIGDICTPEVDFVFDWSAEKERQLLGAYWCKALGDRFIFTSDPRGNVKLWQLFHPIPSVSSTCAKTVDTSLVAEFSSSLGFRIMCLDASFEDEVLVCGDLRGNIVIFPLLKSKLLETKTTSQIKIPSASYFKGAHGISTISSVSIAKLSCNEVEICSTGGDGCICYLEFDREQQSLEFVGMKQVKELSLIQSVSSNYNSPYDLPSCGYAVGFASTDFIIWNLMTESKVVQVPCGGWRRPHTYYFGETNHCFAFVKEESIYIYQQRLADRGRKVCPQNLHAQFHGREMHSLCFVLGNTLIEGNGRHYLSEKSCWIATGCEDGTVRLTRYSPGVESWTASKLLGEHVGGSAVRSICFVSKMHLIAPDATKLSDWKNRENIEMEDTDNPVLLISVGAKRVLTTWLLRNQRPIEQERSKDGNELSCSLGLSSSITFKWLSSDMPVKHSVSQRKTKSSQEKGQLLENAARMGINMDSRPYLLKGKMESEAGLDDKSEDDWRHLAVTAFLVKCIGSSLTVCFVVVASSDATLALRALVLPHRLWFDVASLVPLATPVLALQHIIIPNYMLSGVKNDVGNLYIVISGATDGSIAFWDLTESIEAFMKQLLTLDVDRLVNHNRRPQTGRGSQGGRWWRSLRSRMSKKKPVDDSIGLKTGDGTICCSVDPAMDGLLPVTDHDHSTTVSEAINDHLPIPEPKSADSSPEISAIQPLHVLRNVHQSGVNCLHVSDIEDQKCSEYAPIFSLVSGGDDQALQYLKFCLSLSTTVSDSKMETLESTHLITKYESHVNVVHCSESWIKECSITFLYHDTITSAHTSAVKGVWTDRTWVFSTGLDQRVRCWLIDEHCKLSEQAHSIISVPEPEALHARACGRNCYQIAVAGRGMQMVEFSAA